LPARHPRCAGVVRHHGPMCGRGLHGPLECSMSTSETVVEAPVQTFVLRGRCVVPGVAEGEALVTNERISGWGGVDPRNGTVVETRHELRGQSFAGKILVF